jgi:Zn-dependent peptidase ImmA (M78 family)
LVEFETLPPGRWIDAVLESDADGHGGVVAATRRPDNRRFAFCRALFEYLIASETPSALVTTARTERQKRNRAFAAELLAPTEWLREAWGGQLVGYEALEEAAEALGVSSEVVRRQLENHRIARLID